MLDFKRKIDPSTHEEYIETSLTGKPLLTIAQLNKGTAFTTEERHTFEILGRLPARVENLEEQTARAYEQFHAFKEPLNRSIYLHNIHDINQTLFYNLVGSHLPEMLPTIYTPIVGTAVQEFSKQFRRPRGLYIAYPEQDYIEEILDNRSNPDIDLIVVTDGEGVLGIGDQGIGSIDIPIAKLMVYTLCGGINPTRTLPIYLDAGTNNDTLLNDPFYLGLREHRIEGEKYDAFIERFVSAVKKKFPNAFLHWEDFGRNNARRLLDKYVDQLCTFNDDIQGTGAVTLATVLAGVKHKKEKLSEQNIVIFGAGSAGTGIADQIRDAMVREGTSEKAANKRFWLLDRNGLIHEGRSDINNIMPSQRPYVRPGEEIKTWRVGNPNLITLADVVENIAVTVLIGCSAQGGAFNEKIIRTMAAKVQQPIILPLSNPTEKAEATPDKLLEWSDGRALIATGSPFPPIDFRGNLKHVAQCNNALVFPGLGLGILAVRAKRCTDNLLWAACDALSDFSPINHDPDGPLLPGIEMAKAVSLAVAVAVAKQAMHDGLAQQPIAEAELSATISKLMWQPRYLPYKRKR